MIQPSHADTEFYLRLKNPDYDRYESYTAKSWNLADTGCPESAPGYSRHAPLRTDGWEKFTCGGGIPRYSKFKIKRKRYDSEEYLTWMLDRCGSVETTDKCNNNERALKGRNGYRYIVDAEAGTIRKAADESDLEGIAGSCSSYQRRQLLRGSDLEDGADFDLPILMNSTIKN